MDSGSGTSLTSHNRLSVGADINGQDIISVEWLLCSILVLRSHITLLSTIELLFAGASIHDDAQSGNHIRGFTLRGVSKVLLAVCCTVAVNMLNFKISLGGFLVCLYSLIKFYTLDLASCDFMLNLLHSSGIAVDSRSKLHQCGAP